MDDSDGEGDVCRVCRSKGTPGRPLFCPCLCSGSIKYAHNDCMIRWLSYSNRELCELCNHQITFLKTYAHGMPDRLPVKDVLAFVCTVTVGRLLQDVRSYLVPAVWLCLVPLIEWRIHQCMFNGSFDPLTSSLNVDLWSPDYDFGDINNSLCTLVPTILFFGGLLLIHREVWYSHGVDRNRPDYERLVMDVMFRRDREEDREMDEHQNDIKLLLAKLFGTKGTLVFLNHVILVIFLNTLAVFVLLFCPYHIGKLAITAMALQDKVLVLHFDKFLTILFGYCLIVECLFVVHAMANFIGLGSFKHYIWHCYTVLKVMLLMVVLIVAIPFLVALWMDVCSSSMFDITVNDRIRGFYDSPENFVFLHWLTGLISIRFFIPIFEVFHQVARPGLLWFLKDLIDYTDFFNWTQELIKGNLCNVGRKMIVSATLYATAVVVLVWTPIRAVGCVLPSVLPYTAPTNGHYLDEWSLLIRFLTVTGLRQDVMQRWAKRAVRRWCVDVCRALGTESYLSLGDDADTPPPHARPVRHPAPRLFAVSAAAVLTAAAVGLLAITVPACAIRLAAWPLAAWLPPAPAAGRYRQTHWTELSGTLLNTFAWYMFVDFARQWSRALWSAGRAAAARLSRLFADSPSRTTVASAGLLYVAPRLLLTLFRLFVVLPMVVPAHNTPVTRKMQDDVFRLCCAGLSALLFVCAPGRRVAGRRAAAACAVSLLLAVPYVIAYSAVPLAVDWWRVMPPGTFVVLASAGLVVKLASIWSDTYAEIQQRILDDKYQLGKQLVNYDDKSPESAVAQPVGPTDRPDDDDDE